MVFGTFDGLHPGHVNFLKQAKKRGDWLLAVVARDETVFKIKGCFPQKKEKERLADILRSGIADKAILGGKRNPYSVIKKIKPDVICLGYDQKSFSLGLPRFLKESKIKAKICRLKPYKPKIYHSSIINKKIKNYAGH